jgi:hypothetical protein
MVRRCTIAALLLACAAAILPACAEPASIPPLVCPAGGPIGAVDLRVFSPRGAQPLPLRTINRLEEGDTILYRPLLRPSEQRKGEVAIVLVPADPAAVGEKLRILAPLRAGKPQQWKVPWRVAVVAFVYGPSGLNERKVKTFLSRDDTLVAQLADYAEKTAQTEALIDALSSSSSSAATVQAALQGFSAQYGLNTQVDRTAPPNQQALVVLRALNPAIATYDPISPQGAPQLGQTAGLATTVATMFFGTPVGLAAGGTAMLFELRAVAFPRTEFRSSFSQPLPNDGLGLCGRRDPVPPHTRVAYLWASRVPNTGPPRLAVAKGGSLPAGLKSPLPVIAEEADWKVVDRAHHWTLQPAGGKPVLIPVHKLGDTKTFELDLAHVKPGAYTLAANWDWDPFQVKGRIEVSLLSDFSHARLLSASQDMLVSRTGKVPVTLEGADFEFVTKVEIERVGDKFASPAPAPFVLPLGLRQGPQDRMDVQVNTIDLDPGPYRLIVEQADGKPHTVAFKILPAPPHIDNLPAVLNQGASNLEFLLKGQRLDLLRRVEVAHGTAALAPPVPGQTEERALTLHMEPGIEAGTSLALRAYIEDRSEPLTFADAVRIVGPRPRIAALTISQPADQDVRLDSGELPGGMFLSAMLRVEHLQSNSLVKLGCAQPGGARLTLHLGERSGPLSLQQLAPGELFLSFDTSVWLNGCELRATVANGTEGESDPYTMGRIVRVPNIALFQLAYPTGNGEVNATLTGENLETIERVGWTPDSGEPAPLPLPVGGEGRQQKLVLHVPLPPDSHATLYLWLRGESRPRPTRVRP